LPSNKGRASKHKGWHFSVRANEHLVYDECETNTHKKWHLLLKKLLHKNTVLIVAKLSCKTKVVAKRYSARKNFENN